MVNSKHIDNQVHTDSISRVTTTGKKVGISLPTDAGTGVSEARENVSAGRFSASDGGQL